MQYEIDMDCSACPSHDCCYQSFKDILHDAGVRFTAEREALLKIICNIDGHWSPEELELILEEHNCAISLTTVYRNLPLLEDADIIRRVGAPGTGARAAQYEHIWGREHHDHLLCSSCGKRVEFQYPAIEVLQEAVARDHGFTLERHQLELVGKCSECNARHTREEIAQE